MIKIITNSRCLEEKKYIANILFDQFLGIECQINFEDNVGDTYIIRLPNDESFCLPDVFFSSAEQVWLQKASLPEEPLVYFDVESIVNSPYSASVPIIFGDPLYQDESQNSKAPIDIFGSCFFMITRYEEVCEERRDHHGRFDVEHSIAFREGFLSRAIVNEYLEILWGLIRKKDNSISRKSRDFKKIITHDVDLPSSINFPLTRFIKACGADVIKRKSIRTLWNRLYAYLTKNIFIDPVYNLKFLMDQSENIGLKSEFYFITENGHFGIDGGYDIADPIWVAILKEIHERGHVIGIHPTYNTMYDTERLGNEKFKLESVLERLKIQGAVLGGRHHYLRWDVRNSWRDWDKLGFSYDSSVGYSSISSFRAGTCYEYTTYDLIKRKPLNLKERPLIFHDVTFLQEEHLNAVDGMKELKRVCEFFNGDLVMLFHNNYYITEAQRKNYTNLLNILNL